MATIADMGVQAVQRNNLTLTREEQDFAAEHHELIMVYLTVNHLAFDDWYDVLVFGYLKAVRAWFRRPQVRRWSFATIAKLDMRTARLDQFRYENRPKRRGTVISMDAPITEGDAAPLSGLLASGEDMEEQVVFKMLFESLNSGLSQKEKAVLRLKSEGYTRQEIRRELGLSREEMSTAMAAIQDRCRAELSEAVS